MKVIVKYQIIDYSILIYGMFQENGDIIRDNRITDRISPLGGIASNESWLEQDVHRCTDEIKEMFPNATDIKYELVECHQSEWLVNNYYQY